MIGLAIMTNEKWNELGYQRIVAVERQQDRLRVTFADHDTVVLFLKQIMPWDRGQNKADVTFTDYAVSISTPEDTFDVPWSTFRLMSDRRFAAHWAEEAEKQAKQVGARLKELRKKRNLSGKEVAERAGISPQSLSRIEQGHHNVVFTTLQKILAAMGYTLQDLTEVEMSSASLA